MEEERKDALEMEEEAQEAIEEGAEEESRRAVVFLNVIAKGRDLSL